MNYRHIYHAGNFSDVMKHITLIALLDALQRKEKPYCFLDTHSGIGYYHLQSEQAQKQREYAFGIATLFDHINDDFPAILQRYLQIIKQCNSDGAQPIYPWNIYPGSSEIAYQMARPNDQLIACELHSEDYLTLKKHFFARKNTAIHHMDGYAAMKAFLPPKQHRGLVLIDPPFEVTDEFKLINMALQHALKHWRSGHFMIWYPIKNRDHVAKFYQRIRQYDMPLLIMEAQSTQPIAHEKLHRCGVVLINPPWQVQQQLELNFKKITFCFECEFL